MYIVNKKVRHINWGLGTIVAQDDKYVMVKFDSKESKFSYPEAFRKFLTAVDESIQSTVIQDITRLDEAALEAKRQKEEEKRAIEEKYRLELEEQAKQSKLSSKERAERVEGQRMTFLVFQGSTFDKAYRHGSIWAPLHNAKGSTVPSWETLLDVREGDIILHCVGTYIQAISIAKGRCFETGNPSELNGLEPWQSKVRCIECDYTKIKDPIKTADFKETILQYCNVQYAPFNKNGDGNMGYLYELNKHLARFFVEASTKKNAYLLDLDYIQELLKNA